MSCEGCGDEIPFDVALNEAYTLMAPILVGSVPGPHNPLAQMDFTVPFADEIKRDFERPKFHNDGSIEYPKRGDEVGHPPEINGYRRDEVNPFLFHPLWPVCYTRLQGTDFHGFRGTIDVVMRCANSEAAAYKKDITADICNGCPHKQG